MCRSALDPDEQRERDPDDNGKLVQGECLRKRIDVNGKKYDKSYLTYEDVQPGITLHFVMSSKPNYKRATSLDARPASLSTQGKTMLYQKP
mgnify:CR=1 FL=1